MEIKDIVTPPKTIAVIGLSDNPDRPSHQVAAYLRAHGFTIIPVNPMISQFQGIPSYPSYSAIPKEIQIDVIDIFRKSEEVLNIIQEVIQSERRPIIWMQEGVISEEAKKLAEAEGMYVVMDKCMKKAHQASLI